MAQNFLSCDREQELLLPPSLRDWIADDHLVWTVLDAVKMMDLAAFYGVYRADGHGRAAHDPGMMVALLLYSYAMGERPDRSWAIASAVARLVCRRCRRRTSASAR
jgi:transposase